jgi:hypothetical protein
MNQEQTEKLEKWWGALSSDDRVGVMQVEEGEPVPSEVEAGLAEALGLGPAAGEDEHFPLRVGDELAEFLAEKRESFGGYTV